MQAGKADYVNLLDLSLSLKGRQPVKRCQAELLLFEFTLGLNVTTHKHKEIKIIMG